MVPMVDVVERTAGRDWFIEDLEGNRQDVVAGKCYTTTKNTLKGGDEVMLFSRFWVRVPLAVFADPIALYCSWCGQRVGAYGEHV